MRLKFSISNLQPFQYHVLRYKKKTRPHAGKVSPALVLLCLQESCTDIVPKNYKLDHTSKICPFLAESLIRRVITGKRTSQGLVRDQVHVRLMQF